MASKENKAPLIIGILIPVLLILFVAGSIYLPNLFADPPKQDFAYAVSREDRGRYYPAHNLLSYYSIVDGKLEKKEFPAYVSSWDYSKVPAVNQLHEILGLAGITDPVAAQNQNAFYYEAQKQKFIERQEDFIFYLHDVEENESNKSSFEEVAAFVLDDTPVSEDGFEVIQGRSSGGFFFFNGGYEQQYVIKGTNKYTKRLTIPEGFSFITFVGWIVNSL